MLLVCLGKQVQSVLKYITDCVIEGYAALLMNITFFMGYDAVLPAIWRHFRVPCSWSSPAAPKF